MNARLLVTGWSAYVPGARTSERHQENPGPERAAQVLGRKGLLCKEPATRLALCAVHRAFGFPPGKRPDRSLSPRTAVVACGNLGNVETVADIARTVSVQGPKAVSVLAAPNASSNVVASTVALWFGFGGPNLMVCSGARAGVDGLRLATLLLRARRADRVVLVGAEPADEVATALHATGGGPWPLRAAAACIVLQALPPDAGQDEGTAVLWTVPDRAPWPRSPRAVVGPGGLDPRRQWGDCYGAQGVLALALAAQLAVDDGCQVVGVRYHHRRNSLRALVESVTGGSDA